MAHADIVPYGCVMIDASFKEFCKAAFRCLTTGDRTRAVTELKALWTTKRNPNPVLPCLSVRTAFDLFLRLKQFPPGSEIIMSAVNIPDMTVIVHHHRLRIVALDVNLESMAPKYELLEKLVTGRTVALLLAHVYGKWFDIEPYVKFAKQRGLVLIEDCAEGFHGLDCIGHPESDLSLFSFGPIKYCTSFGGGIAKVRDNELYEQMCAYYDEYPIQKQSEYLYKLLKYSLAFVVLDCPVVIKPAMYMAKCLDINHQKHVVRLLRGFPNNLMEKIRHQPSTALLQTMLLRQSSYESKEIHLANSRADYITQRLPESVTQVGNRAYIKNSWLLPIVVENPDDVVRAMNAVGVDAFRGATQLNVVEPDNGDTYLCHTKQEFLDKYPHEAKFLIDHIIYLPVNKFVPFSELDKIARGVEVAMSMCNQSSASSGSAAVKKPRFVAKL